MKSTTVRFTMLMAALFLSALVSRAEGWRGIIPLKSTRADVERLLGKPNNLGRYQFENERAHIHYAIGSCNLADRCECLVPEGTVIDIYVEPEVELRFSSLKLDRAKLQKTIYPEDPNLAVYSNDEAGIVYAVSERDDDVTTIQYLPSAKDCEEVLKKKRITRRRSLTTACTRPRISENVIENLAAAAARRGG
jgi:hypothetical protein